MSVSTVVASVAVSDLEASVVWYAEVLGRTPGFRPTDGVPECRFADGGSFQLVGPIARSEREDTALKRDPDGNRVIFAGRRKAGLLSAQARGA